MKSGTKVLRSALQLLVICAVASMAMPAYAAYSGDYIPNTAGGLRIAVAREERLIILVDEPTIIKTTLDQGWQHVRDELNWRVVTLLNHMGDESVEVISDLATIDSTELQVMKVKNGVSLKYVLHNNIMRLLLKDVWVVGDLSYVIKFDTELVLTVQSVNQQQLVQIADAAISLQQLTIDGESLTSDLMLPLAEAVVQQMQEYVEDAGSALLAPVQEIAEQVIRSILPPLPADMIYLDIDVDLQDGTLMLCFKSTTTARCRFSARQNHTKNR